MLVQCWTFQLIMLVGQPVFKGYLVCKTRWFVINWELQRDVKKVKSDSARSNYTRVFKWNFETETGLPEPEEFLKLLNCILRSLQSNYRNVVHYFSSCSAFEGRMINLFFVSNNGQRGNWPHSFLNGGKAKFLKGHGVSKYGPKFSKSGWKMGHKKCIKMVQIV